VDDSAFTYCEPTDPLWKRLAVSSIEIATGRNQLKRLYYLHQESGWDGRSFFATAISALSLDLQVDRERLRALPSSGPLVVVANHPFGVLDGIVMCALMEQVRPDFRVLTNAVLLRAPEMREKMLPIDFSETPSARRVSAESRAAAVAHVKAGGCVVIFPAGAVSTSPDRWGREPAVDGPWTPYLARLVQAAKGPVAPIYFEGQNSRLFQVVSHISMVGRLGLFFHEVRRRIGTAFPVRIGAPVVYEDLSAFTERCDLVEDLRRRTMALAQPRPR
jgi:putative hemolysin